MPSLGHRLQRLFLTGLLTLLPIWLTWVVVTFVFGLLSGISKPWVLPVSRGIAASDPRMLGWFDDPWTQTTLALIATVLVMPQLADGWRQRSHRLAGALAGVGVVIAIGVASRLLDFEGFVR